jgi:hypothetical protein
MSWTIVIFFLWLGFDAWCKALDFMKGLLRFVSFAMDKKERSWMMIDQLKFPERSRGIIYS